jgi:tetratricopeptide (TPR) repeat protein
VADEKNLGPGTKSDAAKPAEPGTVSRLLLEIARASEEDLAASWREPLGPGDAVGRYQIRREIGRGGFGAVYEAFDPELGRTVALKALKPGRSRHAVSEEWIRKEAEAVAKLDHPGIVTIFDVGTCPAGAYLVMELLRGETLARRIEQGPFPVDEALRIAEQMAEGLAHAHSRGVLHRDLKPANVFVCEDGRVKLLDFGLAHLLGTEGSSGAGTPAYMAPEQAAGTTVDERADVWAAGMVLGEMLTGKRPVERAPSPGNEAPAGETELMWEAPKGQGVPSAAEAKKPGGVPRPVTKLMGAALSEDPGKRPRDGSSWLADLRSARLLVDRPRRLRRVAAFATAFLLLGLVVSGLATWRIWERQIPGGRPTVAVADFVNETGEGELDGISGLLITSLEQGTQLRVLTRGRMFDVLKQLGKENVERIDEPLAREVGRAARATALLLASIRRLGEGYVVEMRALDPLHDEYIFTVSDRASGKAAVFDLVDRLGATTRRKLGVAAGGPGGASEPVAGITTASPKAWELLFRARQAFDQGRAKEAGDLARAALAEDPDFALAHYLVAEAAVAFVNGWTDPGSVDDVRKLLGEVTQRAHRLPERERLSLQALRAQVDGSWVEAFRIRDQIAEAYPLDKEAQLNAGAVRLRRFEAESAIPYFQRALQLDPGYGFAIEHLAEAIANSGNAPEHLPWLRGQAATATKEGQVRNLAIALLATDEEVEAVALFRKLQQMEGGPWPPEPYAQYLAFHGRADELEELIRQSIEAVPADRVEERNRVRQELELHRGWACVAQGRFAEAWRFIQTLPMIQKNPALLEEQRVGRGQSTGNTDLIRQALVELDRLGALDDPETFGSVALSLAVGGPLELAAPFAERAMSSPRYLDVPPPARPLIEASVDWARGDLDAAERKIAAAERGPGQNFRLAAARMREKLANARGDCSRVVAALEPVRALRYSMLANSRLWDLPEALHSLALCYEKLGDLPRARERNAEMLRLWAKADPDLPMLAEAKALQARLASAGLPPR